MRAKKIPVPLLPPITAQGKKLMSTTDIAISEDEAEDLIDDELKKQDSASVVDDNSSGNKKSQRTTRIIKRKIKVKRQSSKSSKGIVPGPVSAATSGGEE